MVTFNIDNLVSKLNDIREKGKHIEMKNRENFQKALGETIGILSEEKEFLETLKQDYSCKTIMDELNSTIEDLTSKLQKLGMIRFCRDRAEKYLAQVTEKLHTNYLLIVSLISRKNIKMPEINNDDIKKQFLDEITKLNNKIFELEEALRKKEVKVEVKETFPMSDKLCFEGLKYYLGLDGRVDIRKAHDIFLKARDKGSSHANVLLAKIYEKGDSYEKSYFKAFEYYRDAATDSNSTGYHSIAYYAENRIYDQINEHGDFNEMALEFYIKASEKQNSQAYFNLGRIFEYGLIGQEINLEKAVGLYKRAIEIDENPDAMNSLGVMYYKGKFVKQNYSIAFENYFKAAHLGNVDAMNNVGMCFEYGRGTDKNFEKALYYYQLGSERNHPRALTNLAILLIKNNNTLAKEDFKKAIRLLMLSLHLEPNNKDAYFHLGNVFENGLGAPKSIDLALKYYKKAMKLKHYKAQTKYAIAMYNGVPGVLEKDQRKACELLEISANNNEPEALNYLGLLLERGNNYVPQDSSKAVDYLVKSHLKGNDYATLNIALNMKNGESVFKERKEMRSLTYKDLIYQSAKGGNEYAKALHTTINNKANNERK